MKKATAAIVLLQRYQSLQRPWIKDTDMWALQHHQVRGTAAPPGKGHYQHPQVRGIDM
ncbi:hypothetical protein PRUPE_2G215100 [Prunus persica]|uniref:Uncharacterized protein n=1 Tax=Prunus persica TaxID=3760 RepID=A0A251QJ93_PRUPE|nr:hypothetical protein PRUPE_2G215100 [Prunus persica]